MNRISYFSDSPCIGNTVNFQTHVVLEEAMGLQSNYPKNIQVLTQLALNAQKQARATVTALVNLKNPANPTFIKQQNNAINQQVNNNVETKSLKDSKKNLSNELLSEVSHEKLDTGIQDQAGRDDSPVEAVAESRG